MGNLVTARGFECMKKSHTLQPKDQVHETRSEVVPSGEGAWFWVPRAAVQTDTSHVEASHVSTSTRRTAEPTKNRIADIPYSTP
jgi:hypothetical protein